MRHLVEKRPAFKKIKEVRRATFPPCLHVE
jgi:hypothetical protein